MHNSEHSSASQPSATVLLVDDHPKLRRLLCLSLERSGFSVREAANVSEARTLLSGTRPNAILLDLQRATREGLEVLGYIRARNDLGDVPVAFLASDESDDIRGRALGGGADWFGVRPVLLRTLQNQMREFVEHGRPPVRVVGRHRLPAKFGRVAAG